ncbi:MAG: KTSC domain-containing protein [Candidatus Nitrotoga sp. LAW]|nr:MAG: KTSC domain-containing protein [Candidatus Nitrotoga sp. LAW]
MDWIETPESSNITRFAYDDTSYVLKVEFKNGGLYDYFDVPQHIFEGMRSAPSKGQYLAQQIKGAYRYARA